MSVCALFLAMLASCPSSFVTAEHDGTVAYANGDHSGGDYASVKATSSPSSSRGAGPHVGGVLHSTGWGFSGGNGGFNTGGFNSGGFNTGGFNSGGFNTGGSGGTLNNFGSTLGTGASGETAYQRGTAQVQARDRANARAQEQANQKSRHYDNADAGASRQDNQERKGQLQESAFNTQDQQSKGSNSHQSKSYDESHDRAAEKGQKQIDANDKHASSLKSDGRYNRNDQAANSGNKALAASKNAFTHLNKGFKKVGYGYNKDFDNNINERGGFKESVGQDNTHSDVYEENQKDNRSSKGFLDAFRRSNGNNAFRKESDRASNAAQSQNVNNKYGANDRLQNAAGQKSADLEALSNRRNDVFGHRDSAQDKVLREANDQARKEADLHKSAQATASGKKGVQDSKYYGGGSYGPGSGRSPGSGDLAGLPIVGHNGAAGSQTGTVSGLYGNPGSGPVSASSGGVVQPTGIVVGSNGPVKGRQEGSGGNYLNQYGENARQADNGGQTDSSRAQSDAKALNDYNRGRGLNEILEVNGRRQGDWSKDQTGLRDALASGFNGADAKAAKRAGLADRGLNHRLSSSNLEAANKNLQAHELDRVNYKRNQVDTNQVVRKLKKFYHDKNEDGHNDEALNYDRDQGNQDTGEEQQAHKQARTSYNNAAEDAKVNQQGRAYGNLDARQISVADALSRQKDDAGGWKNAQESADSQAQKNRAASDTGRQNSELDTFGRSLTNRNQQLWDKARKDLTSRDQGSQKDQSLDAFFQFAPVSSGNSLRLSRGPSPTRGPASGEGSSGRSPTFNSGGSGSRGGSGFGSNRGPTSSFGGGGGFSGSKFGSDSFGGGFDSPLGGFMETMGSSKFGHHSVQGSGSSGGTSAFPGTPYNNNNPQWRRK